MQTELNNSAYPILQSELPTGWRWVKLGEICSTAEIRDPRNSPNSPFRYVDISSINNLLKRIVTARSILGKDAPSRARQVINANDVIVATTRPNLNAVAFVTEEFDNQICSTGFCVLRPTEFINPLFLFFFVQTKYFIETLSEQVKGMLYPAISNDKVRNMLIPLPSITEQKRISAKLKELMQKIDLAHTACKKQLDSVNALPNAFLREVFESEEAKKWERKKLGEVCEIFSGSSAPQEKIYFKNGKYPFVRVQDLGRYGRTINLVDIKDYINDVAIKELGMVRAEKGTILFPKSGAAIATNNRAILGIDAFIVSHLAALKPIEEIADTYFVYYWLCLTDMIQYMENPGYPSLKLSTISKIFISLPTLEVQHRVTNALKKKIGQIEKLCYVIEKQLVAINALPQVILRRAFRGEL